MDAASWKSKRTTPLTKGIVLILITAAAIGGLVIATLALVGIDTAQMHSASRGWATLLNVDNEDNKASYPK
jgi:hypothetical protein